MRARKGRTPTSFGILRAALPLLLAGGTTSAAFLSRPAGEWATRRETPRLQATVPAEGEGVSPAGGASFRDGPQSPPPTTTSEGAVAPPSTHVLELDQIKPYLSFQKNGKQKVLNVTGLRHLSVILLTMPLWVLAMEVVHWLGDALEDFDGDRSAFDYTGKLWCRSYLMLTNCYPEIAGDVSRLRSGRARTGPAAAEGDEKAVMFVANHSSFLDIAVLCCVLDPVFKFIAKDSLEKFPGVGRQLVGGEHVLLNRSNKRSQLKSFKQAISYLKNGIPVMAFPEGARSPDGRLMDFKGGSFSMAMKANVDIVPISIANTHAVMPGIGFLPVQEGRDKLRVFVHDAISVEGKDEVQIAREVREALLSALPEDQHPLPS